MAPWVPVAVWSGLGFTWVPWPVWSPSWPLVGVLFWSRLGVASVSWFGADPGLTVAPNWPLWLGLEPSCPVLPCSAFWLFCSVFPCCVFWLSVPAGVPVVVWSLLGFTWVPWPVWFPSWPLVGVLFWSGLGLTSASWLGVVLGLTVAPAWSVVPGADGWAFWLFCSVLPCCVF